MVTEGSSNIVISVPGDNGDAAKSARRDRPAAVPSGDLRPAAAATPPPSPARPASAARRPPASARPSGVGRRPERPRRSGLAPAPATSAAAAPRRRPRRGRRPPPAPPRPPPGRRPRAPAGRPRRRRGRQLATLTCSTKARASTASDRPSDYIASCSTGRHDEVPARPGGHRGHEITGAAPARCPPPAVGRPRRLQLQGLGDLGQATPPRNVGNLVARHPRRQVVSAPRINGRHPRRQTQITGSFTQATATELANQLKYGALPLSFTQATRAVDLHRARRRRS